MTNKFLIIEFIIIDAILDGSIEDAEFVESNVFGFQVPQSVPNLDAHLLNPKNTWSDKDAYDTNAEKLARQFYDNFKKFTNTPAGKALESFGPKNL